MKTKLKILTGLVLLIFLTTGLTLVALAETSDEGEALFNPEEVGLAPGGVGLLATINVNTTNDGLIDGDGFCSLREAIEAANTDTAVDACLKGDGDDTINLVAGTYVLTVGQHLLIDSNLTISGAGAGSTIIDGNATSRVFRVRFGADATISNVTITNGSATKGGGIQNQGTLQLTDSIVFSNTATTSDGGGIINDSTIVNPAVLTIANSTITGNKAEGGGGIFNQDGTATINNSTISLNTSTVPTTSLFAVAIGGGIANSAETTNATITVNQSKITTNTVEGLGGGGISNSADFTHTATIILNQTVVEDNIAKGVKTEISSDRGLGGGIRNGFFGTATTAETIMTLNDSTVSSNMAINGGGIANATTLTAAALTLQVTLNNSTVNGNATVANSATSVGNGGGLVNVNGTTSLVNSTVSGNGANGTHATTGGLGGGIFNGDLNKATTLWLTNTTISNNRAQTSLKGDGVANIQNTGTIANFKNSIIDGGCFNFNGTLTSQGHNLDTNNTCNLTQPSDFPNTNPLLGLLQDNGDDTTPHTETHALQGGSKAIDAGDNTICNASPVNSVDQRGETRPGTGSATCDIGAFELQGGNLGLTKTASHALDTVTTITYTITVNNPLAGAASGVVVSDTLPMSVTMVSSNTTNGSTYNPTTGVWSVGSVTGGGGNVVLTLVVTGNLNVGETITNTATISASDPVDLNASNNTDSASITVGSSGNTNVYLPIVIKS